MSQSSTEGSAAAEAEREGGRDAAFPVRVAAIDVGSNALRFVAAEFTAARQRRQLDSIRVPVRLGDEAFREGRLDAERMDRAVHALGRFGRRMDELEVNGYRAVATSAVRESRNAEHFVRRVRAETGLALEAITGAEEARLVWTAVRPRLPEADRPWVLVDVGGGSVEVSLIDSSGICQSESYPLGAVRLLEELDPQRRARPEELYRLIRERAGVLRVPGAARGLELAGLLAAGGNIEALARIGGSGPDASGFSRLEVATLRELADAMSRLSYEQRRERYQLRPDRADVILPAAVAYLQVAELCGVDTVLVPNAGVKEGILVDLVQPR